ITITPTTLPAGTMGTAYSQTLTASGTAGPYTFSISGGALPSGMGLTADGVLSGTPTTFGTFNFIAKATDPSGCMGTQNYALSIGNCPTITVNPTTATLPAGTTFTAYSQNLTASGGALPYIFTVSAGTLPAGLTLATNGTLSGVPTAAGTFNFTVQAR